MSECQHYEFRALDRPLTDNEMIPFWIGPHAEYDNVVAGM